MLRSFCTIVLGTLAAALTACATSTASGDAARVSGESADTDPAMMAECLLERGEARFIEVEAKRALPGAKLGLEAKQGLPWTGAVSSPAPCIRNWALSPGSPATMAQDSASLTIVADAQPGTVFTVSAEIGGEKVSREIAVADPAVAVIQLRAAQQSISGCQRMRIGEFVLDEQNRFGLTFNPFERYVDYWGTYSFDPESGALVLTATGGNNIPDGIDLEGRATRLASGRWRFEGFDFGGVNALPVNGESCIYEF